MRHRTDMHKHIRIDGFALAAMMAAILIVTPRSLAAASCESLTSLKLHETTIVNVESVGQGEFTAQARGGRGPGTQLRDLPAFCREIIKSLEK